jgi:2-polyprenyl-3-methyl-5-hydroxy-6-metoxy-1,4-benzoquinol methylase
VVSREQQVAAEAELAKRLAAAPPADRHKLYGEVYDEIYSMHLGREPDVLEFGASPSLLPLLTRLTSPGDRVLEVGCGAGLLSIALAREGRTVLGVEVSNVILERAQERGKEVADLTFAGTTGLALPAASESFDFVFSVEVLEHLHEGDVGAHLDEVRRVLRPGGRYWLLTPNRLDGISAAGRFSVDVDADADVHLKEWTYGELGAALRAAGFKSIRSPWRNERLLWLPLLPVSWVAATERLPRAILARRAARSILGIIACSIVAENPA